MPIQFPDFQRISFDEANPWLVGAERGQKLTQNAMQFPQDLMAKMLANQIAQVQAKYAEPMAQQDLTKSIQANQWNPKIWQSEIGLRGAQSGLANKETQWYDKEAASKIGLQNAQAQGQGAEAAMNQMKLNYLSKMLGSGGNAGINPSMQGKGTDTGNAGGAGSANSPSTAPSRYGIETPTPTQDDIANKVLFGIDTFSPRQQQSYQRQQKQNDMFTKQIAESVQNANSAQKARQALSIFNNAMDKANFTGEYWGSTPSSGWRTAVHPRSDFSQEQIADNAVANLIPGAMAEIKEAMGAGKFSVIDMQAAQQMKVSRTMNKEARKSASNFMEGIFSRMDEQSKFYQTVANPNAGVDKNTADLLWQNYQNDFPVYDKNTSSFNRNNLHNWPLYTTPKAIASVKATGTYKPTDAEKNSFMMQVPEKGAYVVAPIKRGRVESAFRKGAKLLGSNYISGPNPIMIDRNSQFSDDIDWSVYEKQQDPIPQAVKSSSKGSIGSSLMKGVDTFNRGVEGGIVAPALGFMQGIANIPAGIANTGKHIAESDQFIKELKKRGKYDLPDVPYFDQAPHTLPAEAGEALSLALGSRPLVEKGGEVIERGVDFAKRGIEKGYDYLHPATAGKQAETFRSSIGQGTSSQNIEELGKRAEFARNSQKQQALIPKNELYAQEGKSQVYDVNPKGLPEGNMGKFAKMIAPEDLYSNQSISKMPLRDLQLGMEQRKYDALSKALSDYRAGKVSKEYGGTPLQSFMDKSEDIFNIPELNEKAADKIEDILSLPTERSSKYFKDKEVKDFYFKNSKVLERHENYQKNSTLANYDKLQSAIKEEMRKIADKDSPKYRQLELNATNLNADKEKFMKTLPENMQNLENDFRQKYRNYAETYEKGKKGIGPSETLRNLSQGKHDLVTDAQITKIFGHPTEMDKNIIRDMGPSAAKNAIYAAMQRVKPNDAEGMANTILDLKRTKGFDDIVTTDMENWANNMLHYLNKSESIRRNLGNALKIGGTGVGALTGSMLGGPVGAAVGASLPWLGKGAKFIAEKVRK